MAKSEGDGFRLNHDSFVDILSYWLQRGSLRHKGGKFGRPRTCKGLFTHIAHRFNSQQPAGEQSLKVLQKIIPDIVIDARGGLALDGHGASVFSGRESLVDVKTKTCDAKYGDGDGLPPNSKQGMRRTQPPTVRPARWSPDARLRLRRPT